VSNQTKSGASKLRRKALIPVALALLISMPEFTGCTSKSKAKEQARAAFMAGQQDALLRMKEPRPPSVTVVGNVRNPTVLWNPELTLAKAIIIAGYRGARDPNQILLIRNGQAVQVEPKQLLSGDDMPLQAGDMIQINP
jgi:protein involved in polysaccharide export with SLBB domain